ncbi:hypothetical protein GCM10011411_22390 [Aurantiacibacter arachoides]|nr:hypothetical protein GCM10011411_22390 [Aurantiacibacter arachoides]
MDREFRHDISEQGVHLQEAKFQGVCAMDLKPYTTPRVIDLDRAEINGPVNRNTSETPYDSLGSTS